ncbi:MAG: choice-of-anchor J domain-containing protein [Chitinophagaceae bacterium]
MAAAQGAGWKFVNLSDNPGTNWLVKGANYHGISPFEGTGWLYGSYLASTDVEGILSEWAISPKLIIQNGDKISFYAISNGADDGYADRLQLRMNVFNTSDSIGETSSDIGNFTYPLLDVNQSYSLDPVSGFPNTWTKFEYTVKGLNKPDSGRIALRYYMEFNGGANGDEIGVDKFTYTSISHP